MNEELYKFQKEWFDTIFEPYIKENPNANITYPFFTGVPEQYVNSNKRIMIIGQETRGWGIYKPDWTLKDSRQWTVDYLCYQLRYDTDAVYKERFGRRNSSPFWSFFKLFSNHGIVPCWNNVDKAQRNIDGKTKSLTEEIEIALNQKLPHSNNTLLQKEIEVLKPNAIVFITVPSYVVTMEKALGLRENTLAEYKPTIDNGCVDITNIVHTEIPTFWTYHPRFIVSKKKPLSREEIVKKIIEATEYERF